MTNEERLILLLSRLTFEDGLAGQIEAVLKGSISWDAVYRLSLHHGVSSLLCHNFKRLKLDVPREIIEKFGAAYWATVAQNIRLYDELERILNGVAHEGVEAIVLKGIPLCRCLYQDLGLRPSGDIDLLIRFDDLVRLSPSLRSMGYLPTGEDIQELVRRNWFKTGFFKKNGFPVSLEIHWNCVQPTRARPNIDLMWTRRQNIAMDGLSLRLLSYEDMLLYLCAHLSYHSFDLRLIWMCDLHEIISQKGLTLDWSYIFKQANQQRLQTPLFVALDYLRSVFGADIPANILKEIKINDLRRAYLNAFFDQGTLGYFRYPMNFLKREMFRLFLIDRPMDRLVFCFVGLKRRRAGEWLSLFTHSESRN